MELSHPLRLEVEMSLVGDSHDFVTQIKQGGNVKTAVAKAGNLSRGSIL